MNTTLERHGDVLYEHLPERTRIHQLKCSKCIDDLMNRYKMAFELATLNPEVRIDTNTLEFIY